MPGGWCVLIADCIVCWLRWAALKTSTASTGGARGMVCGVHVAATAADRERGVCAVCVAQQQQASPKSRQRRCVDLCLSNPAGGAGAVYGMQWSARASHAAHYEG